MPKPYPLRVVVRVLEHQGFLFYSQRGSHMKYRKRVGGKILTVIVPAHYRDIPYGTFRSILRQSHLEAEDFEQ